MAKESSKAGFVERATVEIIEPKPVQDFSAGWYWYRGEPTYVFLDNNQLTVRGYNYTTKEEWRRTDIHLSELRRCE